MRHVVADVDEGEGGSVNYKDKEFWEEVNKETSKQIKEEIKRRLDWFNKRKEALKMKKNDKVN